MDASFAINPNGGTALLVPRENFPGNRFLHWSLRADLDPGDLPTLRLVAASNDGHLDIPLPSLAVFAAISREPLLTVFVMDLTEGRPERVARLKRVI